MFSKINNLLIRDKLHIAKLRKISQLKANLSRKKIGHKKIISNCLANAHGFYNYTLEIQSLRFYDLTLNKRWILKLLKPTDKSGIE